MVVRCIIKWIRVLVQFLRGPVAFREPTCSFTVARARACLFPQLFGFGTRPLRGFCGVRVFGCSTHPKPYTLNPCSRPFPICHLCFSLSLQALAVSCSFHLLESVFCELSAASGLRTCFRLRRVVTGLGGGGRGVGHWQLPVPPSPICVCLAPKPFLKPTCIICRVCRYFRALKVPQVSGRQRATNLVVQGLAGQARNA